ncbi:hypothetical protein ABV409_11345 [Flagellimonas sp. DF-77]|uniref:hypothetical protein n=1 Tax=Flagellimonas algarum TaxID=3230298 RepID=UPI0033977AE0
MWRKCVILLFFGCLACGGPVDKEALTHLNGYWEITEVEFPDGGTKQYGMNPTVDYFQLEGMQGFRKKVHPKFDGSFDASNDAEPFTMSAFENGFLIQYDEALEPWEERLVAIDEGSFTIINTEGVRYTYRRYEPIRIEE